MFERFTAFLITIGGRLLYAAVIFGAWLAVKYVIQRLIKKALNGKIAAKGITERKAATMERLFGHVSAFVIYFVMACQILALFGISVTSILAVAGVGGVALAFGAQSLVKDVITGLFIMLEDQFGVGDQITVNGLSGAVESQGLRTTRIRGENGELHIIPNSLIATLTNKNK